MENVLVVNSAALAPLLGEGGFLRNCTEEVIAFIRSAHHFAAREDAEYDTSIKQIIPYIVVRQQERYFLLRRLKKQTEARLHERLSIGVGGHINPCDATGHASILEAGLWRELAEELAIEHIASLNCLGVLDDRSGGVNDFHLGLVYLLEAEGAVAVREIEKMSGSWASLAELEAKFDSLESWSQLVLPHLSA